MNRTRVYCTQVWKCHSETLCTTVMYVLMKMFLKSAKNIPREAQICFEIIYTSDDVMPHAGAKCIYICICM
jgi:hypothetical protein